MKNKGFTLVELLAVVVVLGIVISIAIPTTTTLISNSKKKAFLYDAKAYIDAARYAKLSDNTNKKIYKLNELEVENSKDYYDGAVYIKEDDNGNYKYSVFIYDESSNNLIGSTYFGKLKFLDETELDISKIKSFDEERFGVLLKQNLKKLNENNEFEIISPDNESIIVTINNDGSINEEIGVKLGDLVFLNFHFNSTQDICKSYRAINTNNGRLILFDSESFLNKFIEVSENLSGQLNYYRERIFKKMNDSGRAYVGDDLESLRLLTVNDLYYYLEIEKYGFNQKMLTENKEKIAKLFSGNNNVNVDTFYRSEFFNSKKPRFISNGTYTEDDYCRPNGTYIKNDCFAFELKTFYNNNDPKPLVNVSVTDYLFFNYILELSNYKDYIYSDSTCKELYFGSDK